MTTETTLRCEAKRGRTAQTYRLQQSSIEAMRQAAWDGFVSDYLNGVDDDPGDARARYREDMARIERRASMEQGK